MRHNPLGKRGLRVAELCLGTMTFGEEWGWGASTDESCPDGSSRGGAVHARESSHSP